MRYNPSRQWLLGCILTTILATSLQAQGSPSSAVDAKGVKYVSKDYGGKSPWLEEATHKVAFKYPNYDREMNHEGSALLRLTLDLKTGCVTQATVIKSTGYPSLDKAAVDALKQWQWKPGKWKEFDVPLTFRLKRGFQGLYRRVY